MKRYSYREFLELLGLSESKLTVRLFDLYLDSLIEQTEEDC